MNVERLLTIEATRTPYGPSGTDDTNSQVLTAGTPVTELCWYEPVDSSETDDTVSATYRLYLRPGSTAQAADQLTIAEGTFELDSDPTPFTNPRTHATGYLTTTMRRRA